MVPPPSVVRHDADDTYLVVAADKGTATFSDIANGIAADYGFWLGDAFASGGSVGYDHKAMGITAKGAWEAVKRHFRELGTNIQTTDFTVTGVGDVLEPEHGVAAVGSGGNFALSAARALIDHTDMDAETIARRAMEIAAEICVYTNGNLTVETLG